MSTAQDIYDSLISNPDYQGINGLTREEVVEREANRRARQHRNNEKALSMAVQNSAIDKLAQFLAKAEGEEDDEFGEMEGVPYKSEDYRDTDEGLALGEYITDGLDLLNPANFPLEGELGRLALFYTDPLGQRWRGDTEHSGLEQFYHALSAYVNSEKIDEKRSWPPNSVSDENKERWDITLGDFLDEKENEDPDQIFHHYISHLIDETLNEAVSHKDIPSTFIENWTVRSTKLQEAVPQVKINSDFIQPIVENINEVNEPNVRAKKQQEAENQRASEQGRQRATRSQPIQETTNLSVERYKLLLEGQILYKAAARQPLDTIHLTDTQKETAPADLLEENESFTAISAQINALIDKITNLVKADKDEKGISIPKADIAFIKEHFTPLFRDKEGVLKGGAFNRTISKRIANHKKAIQAFTNEAPAASPEGETAGEALSLSALNEDHLAEHRETWEDNRGLNRWKQWSPLDWKPDPNKTYGTDELVKSPWGEDLLKGWDATFFSKAGRAHLRQAKMITRADVTWDWTTAGLEQFKPIIDALDKPWPVDSSSEAMRNRGMVRTVMVHRILDSIMPPGILDDKGNWKPDAEGTSWAELHEREPRLDANGEKEIISSFTTIDVGDEHLAQAANRQKQNESDTTVSVNDLPGTSSVSSPIEDIEEDAATSGRNHKIWWNTGIPHEIDGYFDTEIDKDTGEAKGYQYPDVLLPRDNDGKEFNPLEKFDKDGIPITRDEAQKTYDKLKDAFRTVSSSLDNDFPSFVPDKAGRPFYYEYNKDEFKDEDIAKFNVLNTNKAILEPWLYRFQEYLDPSVHGQSGRWGMLWQGEPKWPSRSGTYRWHELLSSMAPQGLQVAPADAEGSAVGGDIGELVAKGTKTLDHEGNLNFFVIPHTPHTFDGGTYNPTVEHLQNFRGNFDLPKTDDVARSFLAERYDQDWVNNNFNTAYEDYVKTAVPRRIKGKVQSLKAAQAEQRENIGGFYDWLAADTDEGQPRKSTYTGQTGENEATGGEGNNAGTLTDDVIPGETKEAEDPFDEDRNLIDPDLIGGDDEETEEQRRARELIDNQRQQQAEGEREQNAYRQKLIDQLMAREYKNGVEKGSEEEKIHNDYLDRLSPDKLTNEHDKHVVEANRKDRQNAVNAGAKAEEAKAKDPAMDDDKRKQLIEDYINTYRELYDVPYAKNRIEVLQRASDKDLQQEHKKLLDEFGKKQQNESAGLKTHNANTLASTIKPLAPLQEHLTRDDILMQARRLIHHSVIYGKIMNSDNQQIWNDRWAEVHQLADAANMNLERRLYEDKEEAVDTGDFGATSWLERVGDAHVETQTRRHAHRDAVSRGSELRTNVNYKPHIIGQYDDDGNFQGFYDLKTKDEDGRPQAVDQFDLRFDDDNHYHFHGLDPEKVKDYQKYLALRPTEEDKPTPGDIPPVFGPPPTPTDPELVDLKEKIFGGPNEGAEYKAVRDRFSTIGHLPGAQQLFNNKFTRDKYGRFGTPANPDGSGMAPPRFHQGESDGVGTPGWYHPESESWINPHRYRELINSMGGQPNSGRVVTQGRHFYGKGAEGKSNPVDPRFAFALPTEAKRQQFRSGLDDQNYYVDDTGAIAHANDNFEAGNMQSHDQPQTVNGVIHDWTAQQMGNQYKANPNAFHDERGNLRPVVVVDTPQQTSPIQNMWLELAAGESLGREPGSALARRDKKKQSGWEWFDKKLQQPREVASRLRHPLSSVARDPLSQQELGQQQWWSRRKEAKQKYYDALDWIPVPVVSWLGHLALGLTGFGRNKPEDQIIRRIRQGYQHQAMTEKLTRETANNITVNGQKLSDQYVAPGEQKARTEDYQELKRYFTNQKNFHANQRQEAMKRDKKNPQNVKDVHDHGVESDKWTGFSNTLSQYNSNMPNHWEDINNMYNTHLGKVNQALPADVSFDRWGTTMRQPAGGQPTQEKWNFPPVFGQQDTETQTQEPPQKSIEIPAVFGV